MRMPPEIQETLAERIIYLATASKDGVPNVVPIGGKRVIDDETLLIVDVLLKKTKNNILENPRVALIVEDLNREKPVSYQIKGKAVIHTGEAYLDLAREVSEAAWNRRRGKTGKTVRYKVRSAVLVSVEEIYSNMHGGKQLSEGTAAA